jgi:hypothetical protein
MFLLRVSACLLCLIAVIAPIHGQQASLWDIDSSTVVEDRTTSNTQLRMVFRVPGGDYAAQGATAGASLLEGDRDGTNVAGIAWAFTPRCAPESYEITGSFSTDGQALTLKGRAPVRDATCKITSYEEKNLLFTKKSAATAPPVSSVFPPVAPVTPTPTPAAPGRSYWSHNQSTIYLVANGASRELYYDKPRPGMVAVGARPGSLLFSGTYANGNYSGTAFIFSKRCGTLPYQVSGPVTNNYELITLHGQRPNADANCNITRYSPDTLEFALCEKSPPAGANVLLCP